MKNQTGKIDEDAVEQALARISVTSEKELLDGKNEPRALAIKTWYYNPGPESETLDFSNGKGKIVIQPGGNARGYLSRKYTIPGIDDLLNAANFSIIEVAKTRDDWGLGTILMLLEKKRD